MAVDLRDANVPVVGSGHNDRALALAAVDHGPTRHGTRSAAYVARLLRAGCPRRTHDVTGPSWCAGPESPVRAVSWPARGWRSLTLARLARQMGGRGPDEPRDLLSKVLSGPEFWSRQATPPRLRTYPGSAHCCPHSDRGGPHRIAPT